jgi:hypothetical protein
MRDIRRQHKFALGDDAVCGYLWRMFSRALWTGLLALLAWIPIGRAQSRDVRVDRGERTLFVVSALDVATDSPARVGEPRGLPRQLTSDRRPPTPRALPRVTDEAEQSASSRASTWRRAAAPTPSGWRGFQEKRLILPHDATAPPPPRS